MPLTTQTDYALRTLMYLAARSGRATVADVAGLFGISAGRCSSAASNRPSDSYNSI